MYYKSVIKQKKGEKGRKKRVDLVMIMSVKNVRTLRSDSAEKPPSTPMPRTRGFFSGGGVTEAVGGEERTRRRLR